MHIIVGELFVANRYDARRFFTAGNNLREFETLGLAQRLCGLQTVNMVVPCFACDDTVFRKRCGAAA